MSSFDDREYDQSDTAQGSIISFLSRTGLILLQAVCLLLLSAFPFQIWNLAEVRPAFFLAAAFYWAVFRPRAFPPLAAFLCGLTLDLLYAGPIGLHALTLVVAQGLVRSQRRFLIGQSFVVLWMCFFLVAGGAFFLQWGVHSLFLLETIPPRPLVISAVLTGFVFPPLSWAFYGFSRLFYGPRG
ncbi:MAG: rod shape-determining protein MreD [Alphaproteobacteria bacterium]|nr:rod shape-determining protein MreD [Alphaproteobacteria bacterium]